MIVDNGIEDITRARWRLFFDGFHREIGIGIGIGIEMKEKKEKDGNEEEGSE